MNNIAVKFAVLVALGIGALAASASQSHAAKKFETWVGSLTFTSLTNSCKTVNQTIWFVGTKWHSIYRPKLEASHPNSSLSFIGVRGAMTHVTTNANSNLHGSGTWQGNGVDKYATIVKPGSAATGTYNLKVIPSTVTGATDRVQIKGRINNFFDIANCSITFNGVYTRNVGTD